MKTFAILYFIALTAIAGAGEKKSAASPIFAERVIESWGYRTVGSGRREPSEWETRHFGPARIRFQSIKGLKELKDWKGAYYRFRIAEEIYGTPEEAKRRIERVKDSPPGLDTKMDPHWILCDGVAAGKVACIVSTDSVKFEMEALPAVMKLLKSEVAAK